MRESDILDAGYVLLQFGRALSGAETGSCPAILDSPAGFNSAAPSQARRRL